MRNILAARHCSLLEQYAWSNVLIALDYDGTIAPIVERPEDAAMRTRTKRLLADVAELFPCVVISGRALDDIRDRLRGIRILEAHGNHGMEPTASSEGIAALVREWRTYLESELCTQKGVEVEDKTYSIAVHYRRSREKKKARTAILRSVSALERARIIGGKQVVNVLPQGAPHKGIALEASRRKWGCDTAIYVGDDETDEEVFALEQPGRLLTIRVGAKRSSSAAYCIRDQRQFDVLLSALIEFGRQRRIVREARG